MKKKNAIRLMTAAVTLFFTMNVLAATTWTGAVDDNWSTAGNWTGGVVGGSGDPEVIIDGSDSDGLINVDIDTSLNPLTTLVITNAATDIVFSGNAFNFAPASAGGVDVITSVSNSFVHTFNNDVVFPADGVASIIRILPNDGEFVFNGELSSAESDNLEIRGLVKVNNKITCNNALRLGSNGSAVISNGVDNAIVSVVSVANSAVMVVDTPAGTNFFDGFKFQHNSNADYTFNTANVIGDSTRIIAGGSGKQITYRFNADEDLGYVGVPANTFNLVLGESVNTLSFDGGNNNAWTSFHITGFRDNVIQFGSDSNALTSLQLETITAEGETGGASLDVDGYLKFDAPPPLVTGETVVDYDTSGGNTNARPADIESNTGYTWDFSDTEPLFVNAGQNRTIYGGLASTWSVATNYVPEVELLNGQIWTRVNPQNSSSITMKGMHVWPKEEFLLGSDGTLSFTNGNAMVLSIQFQWGGHASRFVVKQDGIYYASDASIGSGILAIDPSDPTVNWAPISTNDYSIGSFGPMTFTDIEAVGINYDISKSSGASVDCWVTYNDFQVRANVELPPLTEISDVSSALVGDQLILSWQGTNRASYAVQMRENLVFGDWSNVVQNITGVDEIMSVTNATDEPQAFFRTVLEE